MMIARVFIRRVHVAVRPREGSGDSAQGDRAAPELTTALLAQEDRRAARGARRGQGGLGLPAASHRGAGEASREADEAGLRSEHASSAPTDGSPPTRGRQERRQGQGRGQEERSARARSDGATEAALRRGRAQARRRGQDVPQLRRRPPRDEGPVRGGAGDRRPAAALRVQESPAAEVRVQLRLVHRDRARAGQARPRRALLGRLRDLRRHLQVLRPPAARAAGADDGARRARGDEPDALGSDRAARVGRRVGDAAAALPRPRPRGRRRRRDDLGDVRQEARPRQELVRLGVPRRLGRVLRHPRRPQRHEGGGAARDLRRRADVRRLRRRTSRCRTSTRAWSSRTAGPMCAGSSSRSRSPSRSRAERCSTSSASCTRSSRQAAGPRGRGPRRRRATRSRAR